MALPVKAKTWLLSACNRIPYVSLNATMAALLQGVAAHLVANGYICKGSSDGVNASMDGTNRWAGVIGTGATVRGANLVTPVSWIVLTDANGVDILFSYVGGSDDIARISISHTGAYVAAATPTHTPTVPDASEAVLATNTSLINNTASADRLWSCWVANDAKSFRVAVARSAVWVGGLWGVESFSPVPVAAGVVVNPTIGFFFTAATLTNANWSAFTANTAGGYVRTVVSSVARVATCAGTCESFGSGVAAAPATGQNVAPELQGGIDFPIKPMGIYSTTVGTVGKLGHYIDMWMGKTNGGAGNIYGNGEFIAMGTGGDIIWPWDGTPGVPGTAVVMA